MISAAFWFRTLVGFHAALRSDALIPNHAAVIEKECEHNTSAVLSGKSTLVAEHRSRCIKRTVVTLHGNHV